MWTPIFLLFGMRVGMGLQAVVAGETLSTFEAHVGPYAFVSSFVLHQVALVREGFVAERARKTHLLYFVHPSLVSVHEVASAESFPALVTLHRFLSRVFTLVILQGALRGKRFRADATSKGPILDVPLQVFNVPVMRRENGCAVLTLEATSLGVALRFVSKLPISREVTHRTVPALVRAGAVVIVCPLPEHVL